ncbi:ferrous iron transport protein B [Anaerosinus gibii]|uniref:Ferrous iron transport protein B n=1 Tax=Selenobaculum gibii TaxID=3054208 RepID=A0A9Y2ETU8_9FIRM|nr:ferrous iron transport protein B [Selenobaculum gbiensis]WIW70505.1 ferrous iron transport protein B [Selenobaculum gbiensis]
MGCHDELSHIEIPHGAKKIVLVGNPNVGKSVFFNALTGIYVDVSNFPGTTVDISHGKFGGDIVMDTPGVYGISSFNDEEKVARDVILSADIIVNVVDAVHLERDLFLTLQVIDTGIPMVIVLNMMDDVRKQGIRIDLKKLESELGVPIIPAVAVKGVGIKEVKEKLYAAQVGKQPNYVRKAIHGIVDDTCSQADALLIAEGDIHVSARHKTMPREHRETIYQARRERVNEIVDRIVSITHEGSSLSTKIGRMMLRPISGSIILAVAVTLMYYLIGVFVAQDIVDITEDLIMRGYYEPIVRNVVGLFIPEYSILGAYLIGEFGILTMTVTYVFGLLLPLVLGFYFIMSIMEDSGYLPRLATLIDRIMNMVGLNGRAVIPMILGFGCVTMATISTRLMGSERERTIAVALLGLAIPCSAQLGVIAGLLAGIGAKYIVVYILVMLLTLGIVGKALHMILPGKPTDLLIDLPPIRLPRLDNVLTKMMTKSVAFIKEAAPIFALGAAIVTTLEVTNVLVIIQDALAPLTTGILKLPKETANVFIMGLIRRDFGAAGLANMMLEPAQMIVALITITLFVPCIASVIVMFKERGKLEGALIWLGSWVAAFAIGGIVAQVIIK